MGDRAETELYYRFPCSTLTVAGSVETTRAWKDGTPLTIPRADVTLAIEADPRPPIIRLPELAGSHEISLKLMADGRLAAVTGTTRSLLGELLEASAVATSFAAGLIGAAIAPRLPGGGAGGAALRQARADGAEAREDAAEDDAPTQDLELPPEKAWETENPDGDPTRLARGRKVLAELHDSLVERASEMGNTSRPAAAYRRLLAVKAAITEVEGAIAAINTRRDAWYANRYRVVESHRFTLATDQAFRLAAGTAPPARVRRSELRGGSPAAERALRQLRVGVVEIRLEHRDDITVDDAADLEKIEHDNDVGELAAGIWFRVPRPAVIALYRDAADANPDDPQRELELHSVARHWVVDRACRIGSVPLQGGGAMKSSVIFSPDGVAESISVDDEGKLQQLIDALKAAPEHVSTGLGHAKTTVETWSALWSARAQSELDALERRKNELEAEIATRGLEADAAAQVTLKELKDRLERLKVEKEIKSIQAPANPTAEEREAEERRGVAERLRTELAIARAERQLAGFRDDSDPPSTTE